MLLPKKIKQILIINISDLGSLNQINKHIKLH